MGRFGFLLFLVLSFGGTAWADEEQAGRRIYLEGILPSGEPLSALVGFGRTPLAGAAIACANCHGVDGKGRPESSVNPPEITWEELTKPYGHLHSSGRKHGAFDAGAFARAVGEGLDPAGNTLDWAMPRYTLSRPQTEALVAYVKRLAGARAPGIGERTLRIGTVLPQQGDLAGAAAAMRGALAAYIDTVNRAGGIHQRRIELVVAGDYAEAQARFAEEPVFALVSPSESERAGELGELLARTKLPVVGPLTAMPQSLRGQSALVFHIFPGLAEQAALLVDFATRHAGPSLRGAIVASGASPYEEAAQAASRRCVARGCGELARVGWYATRFDAAATVQRLKAESREQLLFLGADDELAQLLEEAGAAMDASWRPTVYAGSALVRTALAARGRFGGDVFLAFPSSPADRSPAALETWRRLRSEHGLEERHEAAQMAALAAATVLVEGLRRAGRDLSPARFVQSLEGLSNFDPGGFAAPVSYGPDRRIGALGGYVVGLERGRGMVPASRWMALDRP